MNLHRIEIRCYKTKSFLRNWVVQDNRPNTTTVRSKTNHASRLQSPEPQARFMLYDRSLVQSCRRSFVSSSFHVVVLSCSRVVVLSYSRSFVSSCFFPKNSPPIVLIPILLLFSEPGFARHCKQPLLKPKATAQPSKTQRTD